MDQEPVAPPPMYAPEIVAEAILYAAENPTRDLLVGDSAVLNSLLGRYSPSANDKVMKVMGFKGQQDSTRKPKPGHHQAMERPSGTLAERGDYQVTVMEHSLYNKAAQNPWITLAIAAATGIALAALFRPSQD